MTAGERILLAGIALGAIVILALIPDNPRNNVDAGSVVDWENATDDPGQKLTITWMGIPAHSGAREDGWIERNLEDRFNIELEPVLMDWNGYRRRRPMMLAGGDIPDVMWNGDPLDVRNNLRNGFIMEVPHELILKYAPEYVKLLNRYGKEAWLYSQYKGRNFGLPTFNEGANQPRISTWRKDWLDKLGITRTPETLDEMYTALKRFRHDDPDGNGKKDTYGWCPDIGHWSLAFVEVFAACNVLAWDFQLVDDNVVWGGIRPEARQALKILRKWYAEELLDPDFVLVSQQSRATERRFVNGKIGYHHPVDSYAAYDLDIPTSMHRQLRDITPGAEMTPGPPLRNAEGRRTGRTWGGAAHIMQFGKHLEEEPEKVIRMLKMMEAITVDEQLYAETRSGKRGLHWDLVPGRGAQLLPAFLGDAKKQLRAAEMLGQNGFSTIFYYPCNLTRTYEMKYKRPESVRFALENQKPEWAIMNVLGKSDVVPSASRYLEDLRNWQMTVFVEIITGDRQLETFDAFVNEWKRRGGDILTAEANEMYREMLMIFERVGASSSRSKGSAHWERGGAR